MPFAVNHPAKGAGRVESAGLTWTRGHVGDAGDCPPRDHPRGEISPRRRSSESRTVRGRQMRPKLGSSGSLLRNRNTRNLGVPLDSPRSLVPHPPTAVWSTLSLNQGSVFSSLPVHHPGQPASPVSVPSARKQPLTGV
ncbi:unnamed protein product [Gulo gulo]|uniref:Uncharacterized protein n=1 Tax=Gulo gulo TaxID=48420 RepID=A0A9X9M415_GULGU|nr:unnamed protein product [Gulo gulo]